MSNTTGLKIKQITPLCQLQDLGRYGYQSYGVTRAGAIDPYSLRVANILVGNSQSTAGLELTLAGAEFVVTAHSMRIAFVGDFPVSVNGNPRPTSCSLHLQEGDTLTIGAATGGIRGYLAVAGGFDVAPALGSHATHTRSGLGGFGSEMKPGAVLPTQLDFAPLSREHFLPRSLQRKSSDTIRVVAGPQTEHFTEQGIADFYNKSFTVSADSDRMGYRMEGTKIEHAGDGNIISDPTVPGSIQVPASGDPIVLMADCPTTGGYPKIATIASVDRGLLAQQSPGSTVRFEQISVEESQTLVREQEVLLNTLSMKLDRH